jgi:hypothetical protein
MSEPKVGVALYGFAPGERVLVEPCQTFNGDTTHGGYGTVTFYSGLHGDSEPARVRVALDNGDYVGCHETKLTRVGERDTRLCLDFHWPLVGPVCICTLDEGHDGLHSCGALRQDLSPLCVAQWES